MSFDPFNPFTQAPRRPQQGRPRAGAAVRPPQLSEKELKRQQKKESNTKRNKVLRFMFNPEFGSSFEGFKESHGTFMRLVANVFLQTGLIDATYPGLRDARQLKLYTLLKAAYENLQYTREGMPRVLLFYTFVGSIVMIALSVLIFIVSIASGPQPRTAPAPANITAPAQALPAAQAPRTR